MANDSLPSAGRGRRPGILERAACRIDPVGPGPGPRSEGPGPLAVRRSSRPPPTLFQSREFFWPAGLDTLPRDLLISVLPDGRK